MNILIILSLNEIYLTLLRGRFGFMKIIIIYYQFIGIIGITITTVYICIYYLSEKLGKNFNIIEIKLEGETF